MGTYSLSNQKRKKTGIKIWSANEVAEQQHPFVADVCIINFLFGEGGCDGILKTFFHFDAAQVLAPHFEFLPENSVNEFCLIRA